MKNFEKYTRNFIAPEHPDMSWTEKLYIEKSPVWCSVDLRDGNQALVVPMNVAEKLIFFESLLKIGFKEIEVGFPAASETEYNFIRRLIDEGRIPEDVWIQVLTPAKQELIQKSFDCVRGAKNVIMHLYNATSVAHREQVFHKTKEEILELADNGARWIKEEAERFDGNLRLEYSPEAFTGTEPDFALAICSAVLDIWQPTPDRKAIINLPATVSLSMPHVYGAQIAYMNRRLPYRDSIVLSLHPHNDRGCGVADAEMGLLAGGEHVEGTLFGNGERTGNVDLVTLALNLYSQGIDPGLDFSDLPALVSMSEEDTGMMVPDRQPYSGELVFTAFSGTHQDAIAKGIEWYKEGKSAHWNVPYLPIDPEDIGRKLEDSVIRINSQSGKGGIGYLISQNYGYHLPPKMMPDVGKTVKSASDQLGKELMPEEVFEIFRKEYINYFDPLDITAADFTNLPEKRISAKIVVMKDGERRELSATGNGHLNAVANALKENLGYQFHLTSYSEHALEDEKGTSSLAAAYVGISNGGRETIWGIGIHGDIMAASVNALVSAINRMERGTK
ncbi:MAG TPA: 2-isopropylmalate synthase [Oscillospiraceae bacterium]|nr:2-isopropylmalate synthase [Oscillospiraceae bacterium]